MSSDCPLKGEQCTNRFQIQAILGLHSFGSNSAVISSLVSEMYDRWRGNMGVPSGDSTTPLIKSRFYHQRKQDLEPHMYCKEKLKHSRFIQFPGNIKTSYSTCRIYPVVVQSLGQTCPPPRGPSLPPPPLRCPSLLPPPLLLQPLFYIRLY